MPAANASNLSVLFTRAFDKSNLSVIDIIGMGSDRPTWEQVKAADLLIVCEDDGTLTAYRTAEMFV